MKKRTVIGFAVAAVLVGAVIVWSRYTNRIVTPGYQPVAAVQAPKVAPRPETAPEPVAAPIPPAPPARPDVPKTTPKFAVNAEQLDVPAMMEERAVGDDNAPVTVVEYFSFTCGHCGHFVLDIMPEVKARLIETGKLRLVYRDFPLDKRAMKAAKLARCAPADKYYDFVEVLFQNQERWVTAPDTEKALMQMGALTGMTDGYMKNCLASVELDNAITKEISEATRRYAITATPVFVFNYGDEVLTGAQPAPKFEEAVARLTAAGTP